MQPCSDRPDAYQEEHLEKKSARQRLDSAGSDDGPNSSREGKDAISHVPERRGPTFGSPYLGATNERNDAVNTRRSAVTAVIVLAVLAGLATLRTHPAAATSPGRNGRIAFSRYRFVNSPLREEIWAANPDGSGLHQVTHAPANYLDIQPEWAPNGSSLLFTRCAPVHGQVHEGRCTVWSVRPDGTGLRMLSRRCSHVGPRCTDDSAGRVSPDGRRIAFDRYNGGQGIGIADTNLHHVRSLFPFGDEKGAPDISGLAWSPGGTELAFTVHNDNGKRVKPVGGRALFVIRANGTGLRRLTAWSLQADGELDWSPDDSHILFRTVTYFADSPGPSDGDLYTIRPDGSDLRQLTHFPPGTGVQLGSYSPDGKKIVFATSNGATTTPGSPGFPDVFTMNTDGTNITRITQTRNWEGTPSWGPA